MAGAWQKMADLFDLFRGGPLYSDGGPLTAAALDGGPPPRPHLTAGFPHGGRCTSAPSRTRRPHTPYGGPRVCVPGVPCHSVVLDIKSETRALINRPLAAILLITDTSQEMTFYQLDVYRQ